MNLYSLTVIVPVYNGENFIKDCINQLSNQSLRNIEIIIVNDGSTDNTAKLLNELTLNNKNFKVIHQINGGVSKARNVGISQANGQYIGFVDVDDCYDEDMFEILYKHANINKLDIVSMDVIGAPNELTILNNNIDAIKMLFTSKIGMSVWSKIYKKEIFDHVKFPEGVQIYEDLSTVYYAFKNSKRIGIVNVDKYHYIRREGSSSRAKVFEKKYFDIIDVVNEICEDAIRLDNSLNYECTQRKATSYLRIAKIYYLRGAPKEYEDRIKEIRKYLKAISLKDRKIYFKKYDFIRINLFLYSMPLFKLMIKTIDYR